ncbi:MAG TPA: GNAT family N-acetyltransferase [Bacteroidales bacterium]|nr:GNAT family N-acetyltransferase [Bacteroidales bacterium]HQL71430.1 GNAT family N-acetyltransferase [Bacteroidales bacterium]
MEITIRKALETDFGAILAMIRELAAFEKALDKVVNTEEFMRNEQSGFECLVAETADKEIAGMALYFYAYYTWVGKSLYLDDLYVKPGFRGQKIGYRLLNEVIGIAKENNCRRIRWQVLDWNTHAIELYRKMGAKLDDEWINCDIEF